jgi:hypothetical protein
MTKKSFTIQQIIIAIILFLETAIVYGNNTVTMSGGQIFKVERIDIPGLINWTFDFQVLSIDSNQGETGFLNVIVDLNSNNEVDTNEWIIRNIPMFLDNGLVSQPQLIVWFHSDQPLIVNTPYSVWATIENEEILDIEEVSNLVSWYHIEIPSIEETTWGEESTWGQEMNSSFSITNRSATLEGKYANPKRQDVPDIDQKPMECGPTSTANSLRWLAKMYSFEEKLPSDDDVLIKELMKAMTGSDNRPFPGLIPGQLESGKEKYIKDKKLPLIVKGGLKDPKAIGGKAFDFIAHELDTDEDVEVLVCCFGNTAHWVTAIGYGVSDDRLFLEVNDPDDKKHGAVEWELQRDGNFVNPTGLKLSRAVSESLLINLIEFYASGSKNGINLTWLTSTEVDNAGFRFWRATKDQYNNYEPILLGEFGDSERISPKFDEGCLTKIQGYLKKDNSNQHSKLISTIGNSAESTCYSFTDTSNLSDGTYYYLLEDIGNNGDSTFHCDQIDAVTIGQGTAIDLPSAINYCKEVTGRND